MSGVCANCYSTKWHPRHGSNRNDVDDQKSRPSKPSYRPRVRSPNHALGLWFVFVKGFYAQSPVRGALPVSTFQVCFTKICLLCLYFTKICPFQKSIV